MIRSEVVAAGSLLKSAVVYILILTMPLQALAAAEVPTLETKSSYLKLQATTEVGAGSLEGEGPLDSVMGIDIEQVVSTEETSRSDFSSFAVILLGLASLLAFFNCQRGRKRSRPHASFGVETEQATFS